jgi:hypothetical protein
VGRIDMDDWHTSSPGLVGDELAELPERPRVQPDALGLPEPYPFADAAQVLQSDPTTSALSLHHDALADLVVDIASPACFPARMPFRPPLRGLGSLPLQLAA